MLCLMLLPLCGASCSLSDNETHVHPCRLQGSLKLLFWTLRCQSLSHKCCPVLLLLLLLHRFKGPCPSGSLAAPWTSPRTYGTTPSSRSRS